MKVDIETDIHLQNLVRHVRERLLENKPIQAWICLKDLENYLHGKNMDGSPIIYGQKRIESSISVWRCKDYADGFIYFENEDKAKDYHEKTGCLMQSLVVRETLS